MHQYHNQESLQSLLVNSLILLTKASWSIMLSIRAWSSQLVGRKFPLQLHLRVVLRCPSTQWRLWGTLCTMHQIYFQHQEWERSQDSWPREMLTWDDCRHLSPVRPSMHSRMTLGENRWTESSLRVIWTHALIRLSRRKSSSKSSKRRQSSPNETVKSSIETWQLLSLTSQSASKDVCSHRSTTWCKALKSNRLSMISFQRTITLEAGSCQTNLLISNLSSIKSTLWMIKSVRSRITKGISSHWSSRLTLTRGMTPWSLASTRPWPCLKVPEKLQANMMHRKWK